MAEGEERPSGGGDDDKGKEEYPIGFRFKPTKEELVQYYLFPKLLGEPTVPNKFVIEADAYGCDPEILTEKYKESSVDDNWYFLSPRYRKYRGGKRPVRGTADKRGRWKPSTGQSKPPEGKKGKGARPTSRFKAKKTASALFRENSLAYYLGSKTDETKTKWLMHELVVPETPGTGLRSKSAAAAGGRSGDMLLNKYVVCRIYKSPMKKWKEIGEAAAAAAAATAAETPTSSKEPECVGEASAALAPSSSKQPQEQPPAKRRAVERQRGHNTGAASRRVSQTTSLPVPGGRQAPERGNNGGGSSAHVPAVGAGAAGRHGPGMPALVHWPPLYNNSMQGPVRVQQPPMVYGHGNRAAGTPSANGQAAPGQGPPASRPCPPHRAAANATAPNAQGPTMMRPPNLAAGQPARPPPPRQQQQQQPLPPPPLPEAEEAYRNLVYARLIAEMKLQKAQQDSAARAGQQGIGQTASTQPACSHDEGGNGNRHVRVQAMAPPLQFPAPHGNYPYSISSNVAQPPHQQQSSSATPAAVETPAAENMPSRQLVPSGANDGSGEGDAATSADNIILQILSAEAGLVAMKN